MTNAKTQPGSLVKFSLDGVPQPKGSGSRKLIPATCPNCRTRISLGSGIGKLGPYVESADLATKTMGANRLKRWSRSVAHAGQLLGMAGGRTLITGPVVLKILARLTRPKTVKREHPTVKPDGDKLSRAVQDALEGVVYAQDSQVIDLQVAKRYSATPGVDVEIHDLSRQSTLI